MQKHFLKQNFTIITRNYQGRHEGMNIGGGSWYFDQILGSIFTNFQLYQVFSLGSFINTKKLIYYKNRARI